MIDYLKYIISRYTKRIPDSLPVKILYLKKISRDIYSHESVVMVSTNDVSEAIEILKYANKVDWDTEYALSKKFSINNPRKTYMSVWYSKQML